MKDTELYERNSVTDMYSLLSIRAENTPENLLFQYKEGKELKSVTVGQFWQDINHLRAYLLKQGIQDGKAALLGENSYYWIVSYFAIVFCDAIVVPLDKDQEPTELAKLLDRSGVNLLVCSSTYSDVAEKLKGHVADENVLLMDDIPGILDTYADSRIKRLRVDPDKVCTIIFTSGTTGEPKGVMLTQRNITSDAMSAIWALWVTGSSVLTLPLHHAFGFTVGVLSAYVAGYPIFISKSLRTFGKELKEFGPENLVVVPLYVETLYNNVWKIARQRNNEQVLRKTIAWSNRLRKIGIDMRRFLFRDVIKELGGNLRNVVCGGSFLDQKYIDGMEELGINVLHGYGITECSPVVTVNRHKKKRASSSGVPLPGFEIRIEDNEICVRGDSVMEGYFEDPKSTAEVIDGDGWFHTGDLGHFDADGFLFVTGRKKNLIILSNGKNVSAEELENKLIRIDNVEEVVVTQEKDAIVAEIYAEDTTGIDEAVKQLNRKMPPYKRIAKVRYRDTQFERTTTQKIKRRYGKSKVEEQGELASRPFKEHLI